MTGETEEGRRDPRRPFCFRVGRAILVASADSTEAIDRREKRANYQKVPSLREFVLVSQDRRQVEIYRREGGGWVADVITEGPVMLASLDLTLPIEAVYQD